MKYLLENPIHMLYLTTILLAIWCEILTVILIVRKKRFRKFETKNRTDHSQLMKNQNTLNTMLKRLGAMLGEDLDLAKSIKSKMEMELIPMLNSNDTIKKLLQDVARYEKMKREDMRLMEEMSKQLDDINHKYEMLKEEKDYEKEALPLEKL